MRCSKGICTGIGFIFKENSVTKEVEAVPCECRLERDSQIDEERSRRKLLDAGISPVFWNRTLDSYKQLNLGSSMIRQANLGCISMLEEFMQEPEKLLSNYNTLWIWSSMGNAGCTSLAVILAMEFIKKNYKVRFLTMQSLLNAFIEFDDKKIYFKELDQAQIYFLDSVFVEGRCSVRGEYTGVQLYNWLNDTLLKDKRFVCTSRVPLSKVDKLYEHSAGIFKKQVISLEIQGTLPIGDNNAIAR
jgi:hypothetical protein